MSGEGAIEAKGMTPPGAFSKSPAPDDVLRCGNARDRPAVGASRLMDQGVLPRPKASLCRCWRCDYLNRRHPLWPSPEVDTLPNIN